VVEWVTHHEKRLEMNSYADAIESRCAELSGPADPPEDYFDYEDYIDAKIARHEEFLMSEGADHLFEGHGE
jgi:hypothetical protein